MANLQDYPATGTQIEAWKEGIKIARRLAKSVGMKPAIDAPDEDNNDDDNGNDGDDEHERDNSCLDNNVRVRDQHHGGNAAEEDYWFYHPFECLGNTFRPNQDEDNESHSCSSTAGDEDNISISRAWCLY